MIENHLKKSSLQLSKDGALLKMWSTDPQIDLNMNHINRCVQFSKIVTNDKPQWRLFLF